MDSHKTIRLRSEILKQRHSAYSNGHATQRLLVNQGTSVQKCSYARFTAVQKEKPRAKAGHSCISELT
jgi:hypothetical protein